MLYNFPEALDGTAFYGNIEYFRQIVDYVSQLDLTDYEVEEDEGLYTASIFKAARGKHMDMVLEVMTMVEKEIVIGETQYQIMILGAVASGDLEFLAQILAMIEGKHEDIEWTGALEYAAESGNLAMFHEIIRKLDEEKIEFSLDSSFQHATQHNDMAMTLEIMSMAEERNIELDMTEAISEVVMSGDKDFCLQLLAITGIENLELNTNRAFWAFHSLDIIDILAGYHLDVPDVLFGYSKSLYPGVEIYIEATYPELKRE